jgi:LacI family transcriptional regulator
MRRSNAPTLQTVADEAGVTAMMASVVLNHARSSTRVSETTRARILEAAARLGYRRNAAALGLSRRIMNTIGVTAVVDGGEINLYYLEILNGILEAAAEYDQNTTVFSLANWETDEHRVLDYCDGRIDGMILIAPQLSADFAAALPCHTPFVIIHGNMSVPTARNIDTDNEGGAFEITRYLLSLGHRRLLHFSGGTNLGARERLLGYRRALEEAGIPFDDSLSIPGGFSVWSGRSLTTDLLRRGDAASLPTAIFCSSDAMAYGCIEVLERHGLRVPEDISVVGFDDTLLARVIRPPLTTVRQPFRQMGHRAVEMLLPSGVDRVREREGVGPSASADETISGIVTEIFAVDLVVRESAGPPPG